MRQINPSPKRFFPQGAPRFPQGAAWVVFAIILAAIVVLAFVAAPAARAVVAFPLALFLPGYALVRLAMRPERFELEHILLAVGSSMAITVFAGLILHGLGAATSVGWMTPLGWATILGLTTLGLAGAARLTGSGRQSKWRGCVRRNRAVLALGELSRRQAVLLLCAAVIGAGAILAARERALWRREFLVTEFWLTPRADARNAVTIGVRNLEGRPAEYDVELMVDGQLAGAWRSIALQDGQAWTAEAELRLNASLGGRAEAWLFRSQDRRLVYRRVWLDMSRT